MTVAVSLTFLLAATASIIIFYRPIPAVPKATSVIGPRIRYPEGRYPVLTLTDGRQRTIKSLLRHDRSLPYGAYLWNDSAVPKGQVWIRVDLALQTLSIFRDGEEIGSTVILYGANSKPTPAGIYPIIEKAVKHHSSLYDAEMPYMLRLTGDGIAIHASEVRLGRATHGCIGVPLAFARRVFAEVRAGDAVEILAPGVSS